MCTNLGNTNGLLTGAVAIDTSGQTVTVKFLNWQYPTVEAFKYNDLNGNGVWNTGEPPLQNWAITLQGVTKWTDADGKVTFGYSDGVLLMPGSYNINETVQAGWVCTNLGNTNGLLTGAVAIDTSGQTVTVKFLNWQYPTVEVLKYNDLNGNGVRDLGEPTLADWHITLNGVTKITDSNGLVTFTYLDIALVIGTYPINETLFNGWRCTNHTDGADVIYITISGQQVYFEFGNQYMLVNPPGHTIGFWKNNILKNEGRYIDPYVLAKGTQVTKHDMSLYLWNVVKEYSTKFDDHAAWIDKIVPGGTNGSFEIAKVKLDVAYKIFLDGTKQNSGMKDKARAQILGLLLTEQLRNAQSDANGGDPAAYTNANVFIPSTICGGFSGTMGDAITYIIGQYNTMNTAGLTTAHCLADWLNNLGWNPSWPEYWKN